MNYTTCETALHSDNPKKSASQFQISFSRLVASAGRVNPYLIWITYEIPVRAVLQW